MTFENYILRIRQRVQDLRTAAGTVISSISDSGIRWSSNNLIEIANNSINETVRLINQYSPSEIMRELGRGFFDAESTLVLASGKAEVPSTMLIITSVVDTVGGNARPYKPIPPDKFDEYLGDTSQPRSDMWLYTVRYSIADSKRYLYCYQADTAVTGDVQVTAIYTKADYGVSDANTDIFLVGIDDFLLDMAERECRDREHNWERSKILDARIALKLGVRGAK